MFELSTGVKLLLSLVLGAFIGLERESYERLPDDPHAQKEAKHNHTTGPGIRTFALITVLGAVSGLLQEQYLSLFIVINSAFFILMIASYVLSTLFTKDYGITTEIAIVFSYLIGMFVTLNIFPIQLTLAFTVVMVLVMSQKRLIKHVVANIHRSEVTGFISYAIIALVVLPFLPNITYQFNDIPALAFLFESYGIQTNIVRNLEIVNPFNLWLIVALITGVDMFGYLLERLIGKNKGWLVASMAGGFISSTAVTQSLAQKSTRTVHVNKLVAAAIFANLTSFFQIFVLIATLNNQLFVQSTLLIVSIVTGALISGLYFLKKDKRSIKHDEKDKEKTHHTTLFALAPALRFALLYMVIKIVSKTALIFFGDTGFLAVSSLAALTGMDAVTINISTLAGNMLTINTAILSLIFANAINLSAKAIYSFIQGKREFAIKFSLSVVLIIAVSFIGLL